MQAAASWAGTGDTGMLQTVEIVEKQSAATIMPQPAPRRRIEVPWRLLRVVFAGMVVISVLAYLVVAHRHDVHFESPTAERAKQEVAEAIEQVAARAGALSLWPEAPEDAAEEEARRLVAGSWHLTGARVHPLPRDLVFYPKGVVLLAGGAQPANGTYRIRDGHLELRLPSGESYFAKVSAGARELRLEPPIGEAVVFRRPR